MVSAYSDRVNNTDYFANKFIGKVEEAFESLPKRVEWTGNITKSGQMSDVVKLPIPSLKTTVSFSRVGVSEGVEGIDTATISQLNQKKTCERINRYVIIMYAICKVMRR